MSAPAGTYFDGNFEAPAQNGPIVPIWLDEERSLIYRIPLIARLDAFTIYPDGSAISGFPGIVIGNEEPQLVEADVLAWTVITADLPPSRQEPMQYVYAYQFFSGGSLVELPIPTQARVTYDYFPIAINAVALPWASAGAISAAWAAASTSPTGWAGTAATNGIAYRAVEVGGSIYWFGTPPAAGDTWILAEDDQLVRWRGNIYQRTRIEVDRRTLTS